MGFGGAASRGLQRPSDAVRALGAPLRLPADLVGAPDPAVLPRSVPRCAAAQGIVLIHSHKGAAVVGWEQGRSAALTRTVGFVGRDCSHLTQDVAYHHPLLLLVLGTSSCNRAGWNMPRVAARRGWPQK